MNPSRRRSGRARGVLAIAGVLALAAGCGGGSGRARISVDHPVALWDVPLRIAVSGLKPGEHTVLRAKSRDAKGELYVSSQAVTADSAGSVELSGDAAMRPLWSLRPVTLESGLDFGFSTPPAGQIVSLSIAGTQTRIRRLVVAAGVRIHPVRHPFYGLFFEPRAGSTQRPGIVVFGGSEGGLSTTLIAALYASHGYPTVALAYFGEPGLPQDLVRIPLEYFAGALHWLGRQPGVDPAKLAVEGISRGSEAAQLLGIHYPRLVHAVMAMVPANVPNCGNGCTGAAWTFRGKAIPYGLDAHPFPDERIDGPIFLDCGGLDSEWPSCPMAKAIVSRLRAHRFRHEVAFLDYPQAGHGVGSLYPNAASYSDLLGGLHADSNDEAAATGWPKLLRFLNAFARG